LKYILKQELTVSDFPYILTATGYNFITTFFYPEFFHQFLIFGRKTCLPAAIPVPFFRHVFKKQ